MRSHACQLVAGENPKGVGPDLPERRLVRNTIIRKEVEDVPRLVEGVVALDAGCIHAVLGRCLGVLSVLPDVIHEAGNQVVMEALIAVDDKAEQIEVRRPLREPFQLVDRVIAHQGGIIFDALVGNL
jgi:hypothetical protein